MMLGLEIQKRNRCESTQFAAIPRLQKLRRCKNGYLALYKVLHVPGDDVIHGKLFRRGYLNLILKIMRDVCKSG